MKVFKLKNVLFFCVLIVVMALMAFLPVPRYITVYLAGDSTMSNKKLTALPENGWGMPFSTFFNSTITIDNRAQNGRSTKTFINEGLWAGITANLHADDYVLIQFGHNDEVPAKTAYINEDGFRNNLLKFIRETRDKKANPVLITPVARRKFDSTATIVGTHEVYSAIVREVAEGQKVPLVDLDKESQALLQKLGPDESKKLFNYLKPGESANYPEGRVDDTHFSQLGALKMAAIVLNGLRSLKLELARYIIASNTDTPNRAGLTGAADTSFNTPSAYRYAVKEYPGIRVVTDSPSALVKEQRDIVYTIRGKRKLHIDAFTPAAKPTMKTPGILIIHGGGWRSGSRGQHVPLAQSLAKEGYAAFTVEYRLSTEALYPVAINDVKTALKWMRANAGKFNIDTGKIAVIGFSAGGQLAALAGVTANNSRFEAKGNNKYSASVQAVVDIDGTLSFIHPESGESGDGRSVTAASLWFGYNRVNGPELWADASPLNHAFENRAPFLFINSSVARMHAGRDDFRKIMDKKAIYTEVHTFDNSPHAFCLFHPWFDPTVQYITVFLKKVFK
jgi:acetyl esterase/lipase/lysophospholipase L1-like esterase